MSTIEMATQCTSCKDLFTIEVTQLRDHIGADLIARGPQGPRYFRIVHIPGGAHAPRMSRRGINAFTHTPPFGKCTGRMAFIGGFQAVEYDDHAEDNDNSHPSLPGALLA